MQDPIVEQRKNLTWSPKKIRAADPDDLMQLMKDYFDFTKDIIKMARETDNAVSKFTTISIEWGKWSHQTNKPIRERIKEHDLFPDNAEQRHLAKKLNLVFIFWWKANYYIENINVPIVFPNAAKILKAIDEMEQITEYFKNVKIEEQEIPKWLT